MKSFRGSDESNKSSSAPVSFLSSNFDNLEKAKAVLAESIINIDQFYPNLEGAIKIYDDKLSLLGDNSENLKDDELKFNEDDTKETVDDINNTKTFYTELGALNMDRREDLERQNSVLPNTLSSTNNNFRTLPNMKQIIDTGASEHYAQAMICVKSAKFTQALVHFTHCIHLKPAEPSFYANRGEVYFQLADFQSAIANYKRACISDPDNQGFFERLAFFYVFQSQILSDQSRFTSALESICKAIEIFPDNQTFQIRAIVILAALNRNSECLALIDKQITNNNANPDFFVLRAKLHANFRNFTLSYYDLIDAVKLKPDHEEAKLVLSRMAQQAEDLKNQSIEMALYNRLHEAINKISLAIELNPIIGDYHVKRGAFHRRMKDFTNAIDDFLMAMDKVDHDENNTVYSLAQKQLVLTYNDFAVQCFEKEYIEEALTLLNKAIQSDKSEPGFYINRADCFYKLQQWQFAKSDYEQSMHLSKEYRFISVNRLARVEFVIGKNHFNNEKYEDAEFGFSESIKYNPQIPTFWNMRARARLILESYKNARLDLIASMCLAELDKDSKGLLKRLFPNKNTNQILQSKLGQLGKHILGQTLKSHLQMMEIDVDSMKPNKLEKEINDKSRPDNCDNKKTKMLNSLENYRVIEESITKLMNSQSSIKTNDTSLKRNSISDIQIPPNQPSICGIVSKSNGSKYFMNDKGAMLKVISPTGWRKFNSMVEMH